MSQTLPLQISPKLAERLDLAQGRQAIYSRFDSFLDRLRAHLQAKRGRASELARFLGVSRQSVSRWIVRRWSCEQIPAWAAVGAMAWYYHQVTAEEDQALRMQIEAARPRPVSYRDHLPQLVSPQADKLVRGSADKPWHGNCGA